jgi:hypothetical protein
MGRHLCAKHGAQSGPHCCEHVWEAIAAENQLPVVRFDVDPLGDSRMVLKYLGCSTCADLCNVAEGTVLVLDSGQHAVLDSWPPTCNVCVDAWLAATA